MDPHQLTEVIRQKVIKNIAAALESKEISPHEVLVDEELSNQEKLVLGLGAMPDYLLMNFIDNTVNLINTVHGQKPHTFGYKVNKEIMDLLNVLGQYAREEISTKEVESYLIENSIVHTRPTNIEPASIAKIVVTLYRTITELNAHHDVDFYSETSDREAYLDEVNNRVSEMLYFLVESTYKNSLH